MFNSRSQVEPRFPAEILNPASSEIRKTNNAIYVLHDCKVLGGSIKGHTVTGQRTILNRDGKAREGVNVGDKVELVPSLSADGKKVFYEIFTTRHSTISDEEAIRLIFGGGKPTSDGDDSPSVVNNAI